MIVTLKNGKTVDIEIPKGWRLMVAGETFTRKDRLYCGDCGVASVPEWVCFDDLIDWNVEDLNFVCIRKVA